MTFICARHIINKITKRKADKRCLNDTQNVLNIESFLCLIDSGSFINIISFHLAPKTYFENLKASKKFVNYSNTGHSDSRLNGKCRVNLKIGDISKNFELFLLNDNFFLKIRNI